MARQSTIKRDPEEEEMRISIPSQILRGGLIAAVLCAAGTASAAELHRSGPVIYPAKIGVSPPLRSIPPARRPAEEGNREVENPLLPHPSLPPGAPRPVDPVVQRSPGINQPTPTGVNFDGIVAAGIAPPDTNGRVGPNHYIQWDNLSFQIFDKSGTSLYGPANGNTLWTGFGGDCESHNNGDPVAQYDLLADRWVMNQFVVGGSNGFSHQCVAVSQSGDPLGAWYLYDFHTGDSLFIDYPHLGIWPDSYYMTGHIFNTAGTIFLGQALFVFDRASMLVGAPAGLQFINVGATYGGALPSDLDSLTPPPSGAPNVVIAPGSPELDGTGSDVLHLWSATATWGGTPTFTVTGPNDISTAAFDAQVCTNFARACVPEPAPATAADYVDAISDRLMYRIGYRHFADHETLVLNHTVKGGSGQASPRWYELRLSGLPDPVNCPAGYPCIFQQGTYSPDGASRWMGSAAMDESGDIALGYSKSSLTVLPEIDVTGRVPGDPLGTMGSEIVMQAGLGIQQATGNRWGDYSAMTVDPRDGCTFWYTDEYLPANGSFNWHTRIASFAYPSCTAPAQGTVSGVVTDCSSGTPIPGAIVQLSNGFSGTTDASGNYSIVVGPGAYTATAMAPARLCNASTPMPVVVVAGNTTTQDFCLTGSPLIVYNASAVDDTGGNDNGTIDFNECVRINVTIENLGCGAATGVTGVLSTTTPGVTVTQPGSAYPDTAINATATNSTPFGLTTSPSFVCGTPIALTLAITDGSGSSSIGFSIPSCQAAPTVVNGSLVVGDATQTARLGRNQIVSACPTAKVCPGPLGTGPRHYDQYLFPNSSPVATCVDIRIDANCGTGELVSGAYAGAYNPANECQNYLGDSGLSGLGTTVPNVTYSVILPAGQNLIVNLAECVQDTFCISYVVTVSGMIALNDGGNTLGLGPATLPGGTVGTAYSQNVFASGGSGPYTYSVASGSLPTGLSLNASTGAITGTPSVEGSFSFDITAVDANLCGARRSYTILICGVVTLSPATLPGGTAGTAYSQAVSASGGVSPYAYSITTGALPTGLSLNASTGAITGTPTTSGTFNFTITAADANLCAGSHAYSIVIACPTITVSPATLPNGSVTSAYSQTVSGSGGTAPYTFAVTAGSLPTGLSLNASSGAITGTPTVTGPFSFDITATDANACTGTTSYTVNINAGGQVLRFFTIAPCRLIDTRRVTGTWGGPPLQAATQRVFPLDGQCTIPADAVAVSANMTTVLPTAGGDLRAFPTGGPVPSSSVINFNAGGIRANNIIVPLTGSPIGSMTIQTDMPSGSTNFLFDANGYFEFVSQ
jgi:hypothetical protein